jgi:hypothetical protein
MSPTLTNTRLRALGLTAADLALGLCPEAVAHLERCALADRVQGPAGRGVGQVHCHSESNDDGAARALASAGALV